MSSETEDLLSRARALGLSRFVFCSRDTAIEYEAVGPDAERYQPTERPALTAVTADGHWRLALPPRWGGHVLTRSPEFINSVFLNFDLVRRGYFHVHLITPAGIEKRSSLWLLLNALLARVLSALLTFGVVFARMLSALLSLGAFFARVLSALLSLAVGFARVLGNWLAQAWQRIHAYLNRPKSRFSVFRSMTARRKATYRVVPNRILLVTPSFGRGGSEQLTIATAELLVGRGYDVCMLALRPLEPGQPGYMDEIKARGLATHILPLHASPEGSMRTLSEELRPYANDLPLWLMNFLDAVVQAMKDFRPAVVHCVLGQGSAIGGLSASVLGVPRIIAQQMAMVMDDMREPDQLYHDAYLALTRNRALVFVSNSKAGADDYERWLALKRNTFRIVSNVLDPSTVRIPTAEEVANFRRRVGLEPEHRVVGTMIRLAPEKDPELWVEAAAAIAERRTDVRFLIAGYGELEEAVRRKIMELGLEDRITMLGAVTDVGLVYAAMDVFMLSSRLEGLPCVLVEAQSAGRPVVATDVGGSAEAFQDGITGRLVRQRSAEALAQAVLEILDDPEWARRAAAAAPRYVEASFGPDPYIEKVLDIYGLPRRWTGRDGSQLLL